jgi:hypothetical protein
VEIVPVVRKGAVTTRRLLSVEKALIAQGVDAGRLHSHRKSTDREVLLSVDEQTLDEDSVVISIQTYGQPMEATTP